MRYLSIACFFVVMVFINLALSADDKAIEISRYNKTTCYQPGEKITVHGKGFGTKKGKKIVLAGNRIHIEISDVVSWANFQIIAILPADSKIKLGERYYIGIQKSDRSEWLSNINKPFTFCGDVKTNSKAVNKKIFHNKKVIPPVKVDPRFKPNETLTIVTDRGVDPNDKPDNRSIGKVNVDADRAERVNKQEDEFINFESKKQRNTSSLVSRGLPKLPLVQIRKLSDKSADFREHQEIMLASANMQAALQLANQLAEYGLSVKRRKHQKNLGIVISVFRLNEDKDIASTINEIRQNLSDLWIDENQRYLLLETKSKNSQVYQQIQWGEQQSSCAKNLTIGLIDTEITPHPELINQKIINKSFLNAGVKAAPADHGTAIAGLLVGQGNNKDHQGLLPNASLYAASVFRERSEQQVDTSAELIISALNWLVGENVRVINLSFGGPHNLILALVLQKLIDADYILVSSAGVSADKVTPLYPAAQPGVLAVTAVDVRGKVLDKDIKGDYIDFTGPGVDIWVAAANGKGKYSSGSSFAAPFVTAAVAVLNVDNKSVYERLRQYSHDLGEAGKDKQFGWGLLNAEKICD